MSKPKMLEKIWKCASHLQKLYSIKPENPVFREWSEKFPKLLNLKKIAVSNTAKKSARLNAFLVNMNWLKHSMY